MERRLESMDPIAVDQDVLKKQGDDLRPFVQEHAQYSKTIDKLNELGMQYDSISRGGIENGSPSRRQSMSPRKPSMTPAGLGSRRSSTQPGKMSLAGSPRRESQLPSFAQESPIQAQLSEINTRYDMIGVRLGDRDREVTIMKEEIKVHYDNMKQIMAFLEKQERNLPKEGLPQDRKESDKTLKQIKAILDQLYENQPLLDETKVGIRDVLKKNPEAPGHEQLDDSLNQVVGRWKELQDKCKARINLLDELKEFHETNDSLNTWLNGKARMMNVLGPIASDPRLVQNQLSQLAVMKEDFNEKIPTRDRYNEIGDFLLENTGDGPDSRKIEDKLDGTNKKWDDLLAALNERERALNDLVGPTSDFLNLSNQLQDNLSKISDDLDDVATSKADVEQKMGALQGISQNLDNQRPLLSDVVGLGGKLQDVLTDPASKSEIKSKIGACERAFNNCRKKLDNALAELENSAREGKEFAAACADVQDMLREFEQLLSDKLAVSADKDTLKHQVQEFVPLYQEIMGKEHEVIMLINRGKDIISRYVA